MADTIDKPIKKPTTRTRRVTPRRKPVSKPSIVNLDNLDNGTSSIKPRNGKFQKLKLSKKRINFLVYLLSPQKN